MSGTRNKQMYSNFCVDRIQMLRQSNWLMEPVCKHDTPAFPTGVLAPAMPSSILSNNAVDIESNLYGIGSNNFIYPTKKPDFTTNKLPYVGFYEVIPLMVPKLDYVVDQRPLMN